MLNFITLNQILVWGRVSVSVQTLYQQRQGNFYFLSYASLTDIWNKNETIYMNCNKTGLVLLVVKILKIKPLLSHKLHWPLFLLHASQHSPSRQRRPASQHSRPGTKTLKLFCRKKPRFKSHPECSSLFLKINYLNFFLFTTTVLFWLFNFCFVRLFLYIWQCYGAGACSIP